MSVLSPVSRRISASLVERGVSVSATVAVLSVALLFGVAGFALQPLWGVAIVVLAVGIGYVVANAHLDRSEAIERCREDALQTTWFQPATLSAPTDAPRRRVPSVPTSVAFMEPSGTDNPTKTY